MKLVKIEFYNIHKKKINELMIRGDNMQVVSVILNNFQKIKRFCDLANKNRGNIDVKSGKYVVDGKSLMGLFSLDLSNEVKVIIHEPITIDINNLK